MYSRVQQLKHEATGIKENIIVDEELPFDLGPLSPKKKRKVVEEEEMHDE